MKSIQKKKREGITHSGDSKVMTENI